MHRPVCSCARRLVAALLAGRMVPRLVIWLCAVALLAPLAGPGVGPAAATEPSYQAMDQGGAGPVQLPPPSATGRDRIQRENQHPGTTRWQSAELRQWADRQRARGPHPRDPHDERQPPAPPQGAPRFGAAAGADSPAGPDSGGGAAAPSAAWVDTVIRGYADQTSVNRGGAIRLHVGTSRPSYDLEVYRMGWYGGTGGRLMQTVSRLVGQNQPVPTPQSGTGLIAASWPVSYTLQTGADWVSGVYLVKLVASTGEVGYIVFVLRDDGDPADIVYQVPVTTWQAYNNWGGKSLYPYNSTGGRAYKVSFDRPYDGWDGAGDLFEGDYNMIRWLESQGYDLTYATSVDLHATASVLTGRKVFLSSWHDEYWSRPMRDNLTAARDQGKHLAFFDANNVYWQVRFESAASGVPNRVMVCYKDAALDPMRSTNPGLTTVTWREPPVNQPENALLGVMFESEFNYGDSFPWVALVPGQWVEIRWPRAPLTNLAAIGIQVGGTSVSYSGNLFIDELAVLPTTATPTRTSTPTTFATAATTATATRTRTPTAVATPTSTSTPIGATTPMRTPTALAGATPSATPFTVQQYVTFYGWPDNNPPGPAIAYPRSEYPSAVHEVAGGTGTYEDPITVASDPTEWPVGTRMYAPFIRKYLVMEDWCGSCVTNWQQLRKYHIDIWMNSNASSGQAYEQCAFKWTQDNGAPIEINPPPGRTVEPRPLFDTTTNTCL